MRPELYHYEIKEVVKIVDGDTFDAIIDLGFNVSIKKRIRMHGIDTPECRTRDLKIKAKGLKAKERLRELLSDHEDEKVFIESFGNGKYGRLIARVLVGARDMAKKDIATLLIMEGHGLKYDGGKR
jgi:micrococcal nuclease|tara:strand:+ start:70 stop:447 length:378 start_codon:yes stop_codon:yes gene_type:complete